MVWVDAAGQVVGPASAGFLSAPVDPKTVGPEYFDDRGFIWRVDPETAEIGPMTGPNLHYAEANCQGPAYLSFPGWLEERYHVPPRVVFTLQGDPTLRVRPDDSAAMPVQLSSVRGSEGGCAAIESDALAIPLESTAPVPPLSEPAATFRPPLRRELRR